MADFQQHKAAFDEVGASLLGLSADSAADAVELTAKLGLEFPLAHGLDAHATSSAIGCYTGVHNGAPHVQPAAFILDAHGTIVHAVYSSGAVGRLTADDALGILRGRAKRRAEAGAAS